MMKLMSKGDVVITNLVDPDIFVPSSHDVLAIWVPLRVNCLLVMVIFGHLDMLIDPALYLLDQSNRGIFG